MVNDNLFNRHIDEVFLKKTRQKTFFFKKNLWS